ncbi:MAG: tyrosine-type recombinase/integrase [Actinomycetota bacterium]
MSRTQAFRRHAEADRFLARLEAARATGSYTDPRLGRTPLAEIVETWYASAAPPLKPKTRASYRGLIDVRILPYLGRRQVASLRPSDVQKWVNELAAEGLSSSRVRQAHIVLGMALDTAVHDGVIARNPARRSGVKLPKLERRQPVALEPEQVERIAEACPAPYDLLVRLLGTTGLRWGEAVALRRRSVDLLRRRLLVTESLAEIGAELIFGPTKSHAERSVPLTNSVSDKVQQHLDERVAVDVDALLFTSEKGRPLRYSNFRREVWNPALNSAKVAKVGLHVLRHSAAAAMIRAGASPKALQVILGHQSAGFTLSVYGHVFEQDMAELAQRLEEIVNPKRRPRSIS